jgi:tetratricopeptide (TPR) repeat protein
MTQEEKDEYMESLRKSVESNPNDATNHFCYAIMLDSLDRKTEAEEHYKKSLEIDSNDAVALSTYADLLRRSLRYYDAEKNVRTALKLMPDYRYALAELGDILADEGYFEEAINEYHNALISHQKAVNSNVSKDPLLETEEPRWESEIRNNLGWCYAQLRNEAKAQDEFKKAKSLDAMNIKAVRNLRAIDKAMKFSPDLSRNQIRISVGPAVLLISSYALFLFGKLSESMFIAQSTLLMAMIIFVLYSNQLSRFKMGTLELEMSEHSLETIRSAVTSKMEH